MRRCFCGKIKNRRSSAAACTTDETLDFYRKEQADGSKDKPASF